MSPTGVLSKEVSLLVECAVSGAPFSFEPSSTDFDWLTFEDLSAHHLLTVPAYRVLSQFRRSVPIGTLQRISSASESTQKQNLVLTVRLLQLLNSFTASDIPVLTLKGPALGQLLYQDFCRRQSVDLDLLVHREDVQRAIEVLNNDGYVLQSGLDWLRPTTLLERCNELTFLAPCGTFVDLHWEISQADRPFHIPLDRLWSSTTNTEIAGRKVPVLSRECLLLFLCIHGAAHCWSRLQWLCDVAKLLESAELFDWNKIFDLTAEARASHVLALGLSLAHDVLNAHLPQKVVQRIHNDRVASHLALQVISRLNSKRTTTPTGVELTIFNARLAETHWAGIRHIAALMKAPTEADAEIIRLPESVLFLYYPLRAARLAARFGRSLLPGQAA